MVEKAPGCNLVMVARSLSLIKQVMVDLNNQLALKTLGLLSYFLGFEAHRDNTGLYLSQTKYVSNSSQG